jgi:hypothetical protein
MTSSRSHLQQHTPPNSTVIPVQGQVRSRPFAAPTQAETASAQPEAYPDLQTQLQTSTRFGHHFGNIAAGTGGDRHTANPATPSLIQPRLTLNTISHQDQPKPELHPIPSLTVNPGQNLLQAKWERVPLQGGKFVIWIEEDGQVKGNPPQGFTEVSIEQFLGFYMHQHPLMQFFTQQGHMIQISFSDENETRLMFGNVELDEKTSQADLLQINHQTQFRLEIILNANLKANFAELMETFTHEVALHGETYIEPIYEIQQLPVQVPIGLYIQDYLKDPLHNEAADHFKMWSGGGSYTQLMAIAKHFFPTYANQLEQAIVKDKATYQDYYETAYQEFQGETDDTDEIEAIRAMMTRLANSQGPEQAQLLKDLRWIFKKAQKEYEKENGSDDDSD